MPKSKKQATRHQALVKIVDSLAYTVSILGSFAVVPQIIKAWHGHSPGLSVATWILFIVIACVWLSYGLVHHKKPLVFYNTVNISLSLLVVVGWLVNN